MTNLLEHTWTRWRFGAMGLSGVLQSVCNGLPRDSYTQLCLSSGNLTARFSSWLSLSPSVLINQTYNHKENLLEMMLPTRCSFLNSRCPCTIDMPPDFTPLRLRWEIPRRLHLPNSPSQPSAPIFIPALLICTTHPLRSPRRSCHCIFIKAFHAGTAHIW